MEFFLIVIYSIIFLGTFVYGYYMKRYTYWKNRGFPFVPPSIPFGNVQVYRRKKNMAQIMREHYNQYKQNVQFIGLYFFYNPILLITNLDLIKAILVRDFNIFPARGLFYNEKDDPISSHLINLEGPKWKILRAKLTPTFTSGKMKFMFPTIVEVAHRFQSTLEKIIDENCYVEVRDILARFTTDVIGTCAFGIECNSLNDPDAEFRRISRKPFESPKLGQFLQLFALSFKKLALSLHITTNHKDVSDFFMKIVKETVEYREKNNIKRNDFMDLLINIKNNETTEENKQNELNESYVFSLEEITAQAFVFFLAGFETSSTVMSYTLYELALNKEIQEKARKCILSTLEKHNGELTYECMMEMTYLDQVINESLRKYPPAPNLIRKAIKDYNIPGTDKIIEKGTTVWIPTYAIQNDPDIYPDPDNYDPERFSLSNIKLRHAQSFLAFGDGPRNCIGMRFGMMQARIGLIMLLKSFRLETFSKTAIPIQFATHGVILSPKGGIWLKIQKY